MKISGFTLIELMVVITIMILVVGGAMAGYIRFSDRREVQEAGKQVQQLFVLAQQKASVREVPQQCIDNNFPLRAYRVTISSTTPQTAALSAICVSNDITARPFPETNGETPVDGNGTYQEIESITLPNSVSVTPTGSYVEFYTLEGGASPARTYTVTGATTYTFSITAGGTISNVE